MVHKLPEHVGPRPAARISQVANTNDRSLQNQARSATSFARHLNAIHLEADNIAKPRRPRRAAAGRRPPLVKAGRWPSELATISSRPAKGPRRKGQRSQRSSAGPGAPDRRDAFLGDVHPGSRLGLSDARPAAQVGKPPGSPLPHARATNMRVRASAARTFSRGSIVRRCS